MMNGKDRSIGDVEFSIHNSKLSITTRIVKTAQQSKPNAK